MDIESTGETLRSRPPADREPMQERQRSSQIATAVEPQTFVSEMAAMRRQPVGLWARLDAQPHLER